MIIKLIDTGCTKGPFINYDQGEGRQIRRMNV